MTETNNIRVKCKGYQHRPSKIEGMHEMGYDPRLYHFTCGSCECYRILSLKLIKRLTNSTQESADRN